MAALSKADVVEALYSANKGDRNACKEMLEELLSLMKDAIRRDGELLISGFGKWETYAKNPRKGRNPATSEPIMLDGRRVCVFRLSRHFRAELNGREE